MRILTLTHDTLDSAVTRSACLVIEFSSDPGDFTERATQVGESSGLEWGHVDMRAEANLAMSFGIKADVALLIFREKVVLYLEGGRHDSARIADLVRRACALDMPSVKAEIKAQKEAETALRLRRICPTALRGPIGT